jgi:hypothetical protein
MSENYSELIIDDELVQGEAEGYLERRLDDAELDAVFEAIFDDWSCFVQDKINQVLDFNEMLERNKGAENEPVRFDAWHRNENAYQPDFKKLRSFKTEADAEQYAHHNFITEYDEWKIVRVEGETETVVWSINIEKAQ